MIECVDFEKSEVKFNASGKFRLPYSLVLNEEKIPEGLQLFLLGNTNLSIFVIHENLKKAIEKAGLTGFVFANLNEVGRYM